MVVGMASFARACAMIPQEHQHHSIGLFKTSLGNNGRVGVGVGVGWVMNPSVGYANAVWFKGKYSNAQVFVGENEPGESVVRRFRKAVMDAGVIAECRRRRSFESPQDVAKRKSQVSRAKKIRNFASLYKEDIISKQLQSSDRVVQHSERYSRAKSTKEEKKNSGKEIKDSDEDDDYWGGPIDGDANF